MNPYKKFSKIQLRNYIKQIDVLSINDGIHKDETFKQICLNGAYIPYIISSYGRVFSTNYMHKKDKVVELKTTTDKDGYFLLIINYNKKSYGYAIHRLVALHFVKNKNKKTKTQVNHKDCNKKHNYYWNLEWVTPKENIEHSWNNNLSHTIGEDNGNNIYPESKIKLVCELLEKNVPMYEIEETTGVSYAMISLILRRKNWTHVSSKYNFSNYVRKRKK